MVRAYPAENDRLPASLGGQNRQRRPEANDVPSGTDRLATQRDVVGNVDRRRPNRASRRARRALQGWRAFETSRRDPCAERLTRSSLDPPQLAGPCRSRPVQAQSPGRREFRAPEDCGSILRTSPFLGRVCANSWHPETTIHPMSVPSRSIPDPRQAHGIRRFVRIVQIRPESAQPAASGMRERPPAASIPHLPVAVVPTRHAHRPLFRRSPYSEANW